jgi:hypothetical protein
VYKIVQAMRFAPGTDREDGLEQWLGDHAELGRRVPGVRRYVQNAVTASLDLVGIDTSIPNAFDGYACVWFDDRDAYAAATTSEEWAAASADAATLFDAEFAGGEIAHAEERVIVDGPYGPIKTVWFCSFPSEVRRDPQRRAKSSAYWTNTHGRHFGVAVPGIGRYLQNHIIDPPSLQRPPFDGFSECWFADIATYEAMNKTPEWAAMNEDAATLFDRELIIAGWSAALTEHVVVP